MNTTVDTNTTVNLAMNSAQKDEFGGMNTGPCNRVRPNPFLHPFIVSVIVIITNAVVILMIITIVTILHLLHGVF